MDSEMKKSLKRNANMLLNAVGLSRWTYDGQVEKAKKGESFFGALAIFPEYAYNPKTGEIEKTGHYTNLVSSDDSKKKAKQQKEKADDRQKQAEIFAEVLGKKLDEKLSSKQNKPKEFGR